MGDVKLKAADPTATEIVIDGFAYQCDAVGDFLIPEEKVVRAVNAGVVRSATCKTEADLADLVLAGKVSAGDTFFCSDLDAPVWRNADNDGWVDGAGDPVLVPPPEEP